MWRGAPLPEAGRANQGVRGRQAAALESAMGWVRSTRRLHTIVAWQVVRQRTRVGLRGSPGPGCFSAFIHCSGGERLDKHQPFHYTWKAAISTLIHWSNRKTILFINNSEYQGSNLHFQQSFKPQGNQPVLFTQSI